MEKIVSIENIRQAQAKILVSFVNRYNIIDTNIDDLNGFVSDLIDYEDQITQQYGGVGSYGVLLKFSCDMLSAKEVLNGVKRVLNYIKASDLPYFVFITPNGVCKIFVCKRTYFDTSTLTIKETYRDMKTGKPCSKNDPNAVLWNKPKEHEISKFTIKRNILDIRKQGDYDRIIEELKGVFYA